MNDSIHKLVDAVYRRADLRREINRLLKARGAPRLHYEPTTEEALRKLLDAELENRGGGNVHNQPTTGENHMYLKTDAEREIWVHAYKVALFGILKTGCGPMFGARHAAACAHAAVREYRAFVMDGKHPESEGAAGEVSADRDEHSTQSENAAPDTQLDT